MINLILETKVLDEAFFGCPEALGMTQLDQTWGTSP